MDPPLVPLGQFVGSLSGYRGTSGLGVGRWSRVTTMTLAQRTVSEAPLSYRKSVDMLREPQLVALRSAFSRSMEISDERGFGHWAGLHGLPLPMYCEHHTDLFLPWHRAYLYFFELSLKDLEPTVSLPWWDWTSTAAHTNGLPAAYTEQDGNPLTGAEIGELARSQGGDSAPERTFRFPDDPRGLPSPSTVSDLIDLGDFLDFSQQLEQVHDDIHVWIGGTVAEVPYAAYDPIFWAHHAMVDRLWRLWQLRHPTAGVPAWLLDRALRPFSMTVAETLSTSALGYDYAAFSSRAIVGG
jgi:tyrosinase